MPLAIVHTLLFVASIASAVLLRHGPSFVTPFVDAEAARAFFAANPLAVKLSAFFFFGSAVPLGIYTATVVSRLRYLGVRAAGTNIALFGGFAASGAIAVSGLCTWVLSVPEVSASLVATRALFFMSFLFGGAGFAVAFGLLAAGVSVTSHFTRLVAALVGDTGNDRRRGRRVVFFEPDRLSRKPGNPGHEVRWIRLADPSWQPLVKNAPSYRSSVR